jgi:hypothetical protein
LAATFVASQNSSGAPDQPSVLAQVHDLLETTLEDVNAESLADAREAVVVGQRLVEGVTQIPAVGQMEAGRLDELALGTNPLEKHHQLQLEEDHWVDRGASAAGIHIPCPVANKRKIELRFQVPVEVVVRNQILQGDGDRFVEAAGLGWTEHDALRDGG